MRTLLLGLLGVGLGFLAQHYAEVWAISYTQAITGRYADVPLDRMRRRVWAARKWGLALFALGQVDVASVLGGWRAFVAVTLGAAVGVWTGIGVAMWGKWRKRNVNDTMAGPDSR